MNRDLPSPAMRFLRRQTRVVVPSLVKELVGAIRKSAPGERRDRVDGLPKGRFRLPNLVNGPFEGLLGSLTLNRDPGDIACRLDQLKISTVGNSRLSIGHAECPNDI